MNLSYETSSAFQAALKWAAYSSTKALGGLPATAAALAIFCPCSSRCDAPDPGVVDRRGRGSRARLAPVPQGTVDRVRVASPGGRRRAAVPSGSLASRSSAGWRFDPPVRLTESRGAAITEPPV